MKKIRIIKTKYDEEISTLPEIEEEKEVVEETVEEVYIEEIPEEIHEEVSPKEAKEHRRPIAEKISEKKAEREAKKNQTAPTGPVKAKGKFEKLYLLMCIVNDGQGNAIKDIAFGKGNGAAAYLSHGKGTASNDLYEVLWFSNESKQVIFAPVRGNKWLETKEALEKRFAVSNYSKGVGAIFQIDSMIGRSAYKFLANQKDIDNKLVEEQTMDESKLNKDYSVIFAIVNDGYTDLVMDAAKKAGARGGTIIHAKGTGNKEVERFFGIVVTPEKEIVVIMVPKEIKDNVLSSIYEMAGLSTKGQGIAFAINASDVVGLSTSEEKEEEEPKAEEETKEEDNNAESAE